jgi:hypothetical protein
MIHILPLFYTASFSTVKELSSEIKMGRNWYQSAGIALLLGRWTFLFYIKGSASWFHKKCFAATLAQIISNVGNNW